MTHSAILLLSIAGLAAGFIDAIAGGGGLITIPSLLFVGIPPHVALGSNKVAGTVGVFSSSIVYWRKRLYRLQHWRFAVVIAMLGSALGSIAIHFLSADWLTKFIPCLLIAIIIYMAIPKHRLHNPPQPNYHAPPLKISLLNSILGFYDGFFGPGTGSFWTTALVYFFKLDLLQATAIAKLMNFASNIIAAIVFISFGSVNYLAALILMIGYVIGSTIGANSAIKHGRKLIRPLFLIVASVICIKLIINTF